MTKNTSQSIRKICGIASSVSIVIAGACLIWACLGIYGTGDGTFSREAVAAAFSPIAIPVYLCLGLVIAGFLLDLILPDSETKRTVTKNPAMTLKRLRAKLDLGKCGEELQSAILSQVAKRRNDRIITAALLAVGGVIFFWIALQPDAFHQSQINGSMIRNISLLACCVAPATVFAVFAAYRGRKSMEDEIALLKTAPAEAKISGETEGACNCRINRIRTAIAVAAVVFLLYGFCTGGTADVLTKAVNICTECVGLG